MNGMEMISINVYKHLDPPTKTVTIKHHLF